MSRAEVRVTAQASHGYITVLSHFKSDRRNNNPSDAMSLLFGKICIHKGITFLQAIPWERYEPAQRQ